MISNISTLNIILAYTGAAALLNVLYLMRSCRSAWDIISVCSSHLNFCILGYVVQQSTVNI